MKKSILNFYLYGICFIFSYIFKTLKLFFIFKIHFLFSALVLMGLKWAVTGQEQHLALMDSTLPLALLMDLYLFGMFQQIKLKMFSKIIRTYCFFYFIIFDRLFFFLIANFSNYFMIIKSFIIFIKWYVNFPRININL